MVDRLKYLLEEARDCLVIGLSAIAFFVGLTLIFSSIIWVIGYISYLVNGLSLAVRERIPNSNFFDAVFIEGFGVTIFIFGLAISVLIASLVSYKIAQLIKWILTGNKNIFW